MLIGKTKGTFLIREKCLFHLLLQGIIYAEINCLCYYWIFAQLIDGALGMAYGVTSTSLLLMFGIAPAVASASVHLAEVVTTAASGASHIKFGNVDKYTVSRLTLPGAIGAFVGACF